MADPKYADLPGIALDEPDIYESSDLPESDQAADFYEEETNIVENINISTTDAFNKFKGKSLEGGKVDFSDRVGKYRRTGYEAFSVDWELLPKGEKETTLQKYQRLQCEIKELLEEVNLIKKDKTGEKSCVVSEEQVTLALRKLDDLQLEDALGKDLISSMVDPQGTLLKKLTAQLESFKSKLSKQPEAQVDTMEGITYQLNYRPEQAKLLQTQRIVELEKRLHRLETVLGSSSDKLSRITSVTNKKTLLEAAEHLSATASLLDSSQLNHIEGRLTALGQKMDLIAEKKKEFVELTEKDKMILELYELVKDTENVSKLMPQTVERLKALEGLHQKATTFTSTLTQVESLQGEIKDHIEHNKTLLQGVQESFASNLNEINQTVSGLDARIKALKKK